MTLYEATHEQCYPEADGHCLVTAKTKIANLLDDHWAHSQQWPNNDQWITAAKHDIRHALTIARNRVRELKQAQKIIDAIQEK